MTLHPSPIPHRDSDGTFAGAILRRAIAAIAGALVIVAPPSVIAASGSWSQFAASPFGAIVDMRLAPDGKTLWIGNTQLLSPPAQTPSLPRIRQSAFPNVAFSAYSNAGLDNATKDNGFSALWLTKTGAPVLRCSRPVPNGGYAAPPPFMFYFDTGANAWAHATLQNNEESRWPGPPKNIDYDDNQDLLVCAGSNVMQSSDGQNWTVRSDILQFIYAPPPYQPGYGNNGKPAWVTIPGPYNNAPVLNSSTFDWSFGLARMPWGEIFIGGEAGCYVHSLDNGYTWEWFDPTWSQPQRDGNGYPMYRNPGVVRLTQLYHLVATKDGEVMFNSDRNGGHNYFILTAAGHVIEAQQGFPSGSARPGICTNFTTVAASGETFMSVQWLGSPTPTGNIADVLKWDGTSWSVITPNSGGWKVAVPNSLFTDGKSFYVAAASPSSIYKWTPDLSGGAPPVVAITGGSSATGAPSCTLDPSSGLGSVHLSAAASATSGHPMSFRWAARGPGAVVFDDASALSPAAQFFVPGNYVLNCQATDMVTGLRAGASVIVHVKAASGGAAPTIAAQPKNATLTPGQPVTFTVQAGGAGPLRYQWKRNGVDLVGASAQSASLSFTSTAADDGATYYCTVASPFGKAVSNCGTLGTPPVIVAQPQNQTVAAGATATFAVAAGGTPLMQWQWRRDGVPISGANLGTYSTSVPGAYSCDVTNVLGATSSAAATLTNGAGPAVYSLSVNGTASLAVTGSGIYPVGAVVGISVEREPPGGYYAQFDHWAVGNGVPAGVTVSIADPLALATTVTVSGANAAGTTIPIVAYFNTPNLGFLTVSSGLGTARAKVGDTLDIAALPAPAGTVFDKWIGATVANPNAPATKVTLTAAQTSVRASYVPAFVKWKSQRFGANAANAVVAGDLADPDGDGLANLLEYALGADPSNPTPDIVPVLGRVAIGGVEYLTIAFTRDPAATDVTFRVEASDDMVTWTQGSSYSVVGGDAPNTPATSDITPAGSPLGYTVVRDNQPLTGGAQRFLRLSVTRP